MIRAGFWQKVRARGLAGIVKAAYRRAFDNPHSYLKRVTGIIHVGANLGQERELYAKYKLKVLWIEPLPHIFEKLRENIRGFPDQIAINHLITDKDDAEYLFHVARRGFVVNFGVCAAQGHLAGGSRNIAANDKIRYP